MTGESNDRFASARKGLIEAVHAKAAAGRPFFTAGAQLRRYAADNLLAAASQDERVIDDAASDALNAALLLGQSTASSSMDIAAKLAVLARDLISEAGEGLDATTTARLSLTLGALVDVLVRHYGGDVVLPDGASEAITEERAVRWLSADARWCGRTGL